ncbi:MAG: glycosyltransferase family 2 protein [Planctomycetes bacterium]|nr:glycosyltransferase family 2 protein [Planctomycetota bacterium]
MTSVGASPRNDLGLVLIGRNEGERLRRALVATRGQFAASVYVDSRSTDGSVELARSFGIDVVELDLSVPFTAARARNAGFERLVAAHPEVALVQFVDGDCELDPRWLDRGLLELERDPRLAVVAGRRRERHPDASVYNLLCDLEWDTPIGPGSDCGGDALMRVEAFRAVGGFDPALIAGEEPDLCTRLRARGLGVLRVDAEMTLHDAAMTRFGQWWKRAVRTGYTAAESWARQGSSIGARHRRHVFSALFFGACVPIAILGLLALPASIAPWTPRLVAVGVLASGYGVIFLQILAARKRHGDPPRARRVYATFCLLGKLPELEGIVRYVLNRVRGRRARWIEYKDVPARPGGSARPS